MVAIRTTTPARARGPRQPDPNQLGLFGLFHTLSGPVVPTVSPPARREGMTTEPGVPTSKTNPVADCCPYSGWYSGLASREFAGNEASFIRETLRAVENLADFQYVREDGSPERSAMTKTGQHLIAGFRGWGGSGALWNESDYRNWLATGEPGAWGAKYGASRTRLGELMSDAERQEALSATLTAYYTPRWLIAQLWQAITDTGFTGGTVLEPGAGSGHFFGLMPQAIRDNSTFIAVEKDPVSARVIGALYPGVTLHAQGLERVSIEPGSVDLVVGNVPFGQFSVFDKARPFLSKQRIHNYFIGRSVDALREGGVAVLLTSTGTLDNADPEFRQWLVERGMHLIRAVRLPAGALAEANTEVCTDVLILQKNSTVTSEVAYVRTQTILSRPVMDSDGQTVTGHQQLAVNAYFERFPAQLIGQMTWADVVGKGGLYRADQPTCYHPAPTVAAIANQVQTALSDLPVLYESRPDRETVFRQPYGAASNGAASNGAAIGFTGSVKIKGRSYTQARIITGYNALKTAYKTLLRDERTSTGSEKDRDRASVEQSRAVCREAYTEFTGFFGSLNQNRAINFLETYDPQFAFVQSLEIRSEEIGSQEIGSKSTTGKTYIASQILTRRVTQSACGPQTLQSIEDAVSWSEALYNHLDLAAMGRWLGCSSLSVAARLRAGGAGFEEPDGTWQSRAAYLSGNVGTKLRQLQVMQETADQTAEADRYSVNVAALRAVQPQRIPLSLITFGLGSQWIPEPIAQEFTRQSLAMPTVSVSFHDRAQLFIVTNNHAEYSPQNRSLGGAGRTAIQLIEAGLNNRTIEITRIIPGPGPETKPRTVRDVEATAAAIAALEHLNELFEQFGRSHYARAIEDSYNDTFNQHRPRTYQPGPLLVLPGANPAITLYEHQRRAIERSKQQNVLLAHSVGTGKAQPLSAKILTPSGWVCMGDLSVGDQVISPDGSTTHVTGVFPQGEREIFEVGFSDGSKTECCEEHLWLTKTYAERNAGNNERRLGRTWACSQATVRSLGEIRNTLIAPHLGAKNHSIPLIEPVPFTEKQFLMEPYLLGVLLGDGCVSQNFAGFSSADKQIIDRVARCLPADVRVSFRSKYDYYIVKKVQTGRFNSVIQAIKKMGLMGAKSDTKFIPECYFTGSISQRTALLQGLLDTDGTIDKRTGAVMFTSVSPRLSSGIVALVGSLGGTTSTKSKRPTFTYKGIQKVGKLSYQVSICLPNQIQPFSTERKTAYWKPKTKYHPVRYITSVESVGTKPAQCISVAHPSHLYITDDYIVTHNTYTLISSVMELIRLGRVRKAMISVQNSTLTDFTRAFRLLYPAAVVYAPTPPELSGAANRKRFLQRIAANCFDAVIIPQSMLRLIPDSPAILESFIQEEIGQVEALISVSEGGEAVINAPSGKRYMKRLAELKLRVASQRLEQASRTVDTMLSFEELGVDMLCLDECFPYETPILTSEGVMPIGELVAQRKKVLVLSFCPENRNFEWMPVTNWLKKPLVKRLVKVTHKQGCFTCTEDHKIWTNEEGYVKAGELTNYHTIIFTPLPTLSTKPGSDCREPVLQQTVCLDLLREHTSGPGQYQTINGVAPRNGLSMEQAPSGQTSRPHAGLPVVSAATCEKSEEPVLQQKLRCILPKLTTGYGRNFSEQMPKNEGGFDSGKTKSGQGGTNATQQSNDQPGKCRKDECLVIGQNVLVQGRKRFIDRATKTSLYSTKFAIEPNGMGDSDRTRCRTVPFTPQSLQSGYWHTDDEAGNRSGREVTQTKEMEVSRQTENSHFECVRVVSVTFYQRAGDAGVGFGDGGDNYVYDLTVAKNHNYFASGVLVSNCHKYKRLGFRTNRRNVKGIDTEGSQEALSALCKIRAVTDIGGRVMLATGTPISNTMAEVHTMMRYIAPEVLGQYRISSFDGFAGSFGQIVPSFELTTSGQFKAVERFAKFVNVRQLIDIYRQHVDIVLTDDVGEFARDNKIPKLVGNAFTRLVIPQTEGVQAELIRIREKLQWFENLEGGQKRANCHVPLVLFGEARRATLDVRLLDSSGPDEPRNKLGAAAGEIARIYHQSADYRGTQLVFADLYQSPATEDEIYQEDGQMKYRSVKATPARRFNLFDELKKRLIAQGIAADKIVVCPADMKDREAVFVRVRTGQIRVLLGTTDRMGVGVNVQERVAALHHLDAPYRPTDFEQRNGRILRQGNLHAGWNIPVEVITYGVEKTLDATAYGRLALKQKFINQVLKGEVSDSTMSDIGAEDDFASLSFQEMMATLSGSQYALAYAAKKLAVSRLISQRKTWQRQVREAATQVRFSGELIAENTAMLTRIQPAHDRVLPAFLPGSLGSGIQINRISLDNGPEIGEEFGAAMQGILARFSIATKHHRDASAYVKVNGIGFWVKSQVYINPEGRKITSAAFWYDETGNDTEPRKPVLQGDFQVGTGFMVSLRAAINRFFPKPREIAEHTDYHARMIAEFTPRIDQPFTKARELAGLETELMNLEKAMLTEGEAEEKNPPAGSDNPHQQDEPVA